MRVLKPMSPISEDSFRNKEDVNVVMNTYN